MYFFFLKCGKIVTTYVISFFFSKPLNVVDKILRKNTFKKLFRCPTVEHTTLEVMAMADVAFSDRHFLLQFVQFKRCLMSFR